MGNINTVVGGNYKGENIIVSWGNVSIGKKNINPQEIKNIQVTDINVLKRADNENGIYYIIDIQFNSGEASKILVDKELYNKIIEKFPSKKANHLTILLNKGYKIIGYSSCMIAGNGLGAGTMAHTILLQKGLDIQQIVINTWMQKEMGRYYHCLSAEK